MLGNLGSTQMSARGDINLIGWQDIVLGVEILKDRQYGIKLEL